MWLYTSKGMASIVAHNTKPGFYLVRCRCAEHIEHFASLIKRDPTIIKLPTADYYFRFLVNQSELNSLVLKAANQIEYPDFKSSIPKEQKRYKIACSNAWHALNSVYIVGGVTNEQA